MSEDIALNLGVALIDACQHESDAETGKLWGISIYVLGLPCHKHWGFNVVGIGVLLYVLGYRAISIGASM